jgi:hypothetical protein
MFIDEPADELGKAEGVEHFVLGARKLKINERKGLEKPLQFFFLEFLSL